MMMIIHSLTNIFRIAKYLLCSSYFVYRFYLNTRLISLLTPSRFKNNKKKTHFIFLQKRFQTKNELLLT